MIPATSFLCILLFTIPLVSAATPSDQHPARIVLKPPNGPITFPTPCVPQPVSTYFATTETTRCKPGKTGRVITLTFNDACTFFTYKVKLCRRAKVDRYAAKITRCLRRSIRRCSMGIFGKCGSAIREDCPNGKLLQLSAVA